MESTRPQLAQPQVSLPTGSLVLSSQIPQRRYLGRPPGDAHMKGIVTADFGVGQAPALLVGFHEGGLLVRQDVANDHGGSSNERGLWGGGDSLVTAHPAPKVLAWPQACSGQSQSLLHKSLQGPNTASFGGL